MPVDITAQPCEVCGVLTTQKCAACDSAGISLFFCSRDHQKLVWPAHKLVCGPGKALPFALVPLRDDEIAQAKALCIAMSASTASKLVTTFRSALEQLGRAPAQEVLDALDGDVYDVRRVPHKPFVVCLVRSVLRQLAGPDADVADPHLYGAVLYDDDLRTLDVDLASAFCATLLSGLCHMLVRTLAMPHDYSHTLWFSLFQHKVFIICRLGQLSARRPADAEAKAHYSGAKDRTNAWLRSGLGTDDPVLRSVGSKMRIVHGVEAHKFPR